MLQVKTDQPPRQRGVLGGAVLPVFGELGRIGGRHPVFCPKFPGPSAALAQGEAHGDMVDVKRGESLKESVNKSVHVVLNAGAGPEPEISDAYGHLKVSLSELAVFKQVGVGKLEILLQAIRVG